VIETARRPTLTGGRSIRLFRGIITGRFVTSRKVTGTWRVRTVFYFNDLFPDNTTPVDVCDTGVVSWTARLRR